MSTTGYFIVPLLAFVSAVALPLQARAEVDSLDVNSRTADYTSALSRVVGSRVFRRSVAASLFRHGQAFTELSGQLDWREEERPFQPAYGDGELRGAFHVESYLPLGPRSAVLAGADYENGQQRNVCWNSTSDYALLRPYVLADSIGGDLQCEQYRFYGGYSRVDGCFNYGVGAAYRARQEYRQADPRPRNITADLTAELSGGYLLERYVVGAAVGIRVYKQQQSVDFYDPNGANTSELHLTGLGTFFKRYSGTNYTSVQYDGTGCRAALTLVPRRRDGWYALADYERLSADRRLPGVNNVTLTTLTLQTLTASASYRATSARFDWGVSATVVYGLRQGTENVLGSGNAGDNLPLASQAMYDSYAVGACVEGVLAWKCPAGTWTLQPSAAFDRENEEYAYPARKVEVASLRLGMATDFTRLCGDWLTVAEVGGWRTANLSGTFNLPSDDTDPRLYAYEQETYRRRSGSWTTAQARLRVQRRMWPGTAVFVSALYVRRFHDGGLSDSRLQLAAGMCF